MACRVEGVHASYVGRNEADGARSGDRCLILSDEGTMIHVRWITGSLKDSYGQVYPRDIVADIPGRDFERRVAINVTGVYQAGGTVALFEALESEGHFENLRQAAREALHLMHERLSADDEWGMIREALGPEANEVEASAIVAAIESVSGADR